MNVQFVGKSVKLSICVLIFAYLIQTERILINIMVIIIK